MSTLEFPSLAPELSRKLRRLDLRVRMLAILRGAGLLLIVLAAGLTVALIADLKWDLSPVSRLAVLAGTGLAAVAVAVPKVIWPAIRRHSPAELAAMVERLHPELRERLTSTIELSDPEEPDAFKGSALMREMLAAQTVRSVGRLDFSEAVPAGRSVRLACAGLVALLVLLAPFAVSRSGYALLWTRLLDPWGNHESAGNLYFAVVGGGPGRRSRQRCRDSRRAPLAEVPGRDARDGLAALDECGRGNRFTADGL